MASPFTRRQHGQQGPVSLPSLVVNSYPGFVSWQPLRVWEGGPGAAHPTWLFQRRGPLEWGPNADICTLITLHAILWLPLSLALRPVSLHLLDYRLLGAAKGLMLLPSHAAFRTQAVCTHARGSFIRCLLEEWIIEHCLPPSLSIASHILFADFVSCLSKQHLYPGFIWWHVPRQNTVPGTPWVLNKCLFCEWMKEWINE